MKNKKHNINKEKFIDSFLEVEKKLYGLTIEERNRVKREGLKAIDEGEFWFKVFKKYINKQT